MIIRLIIRSSYFFGALFFAVIAAPQVLSAQAFEGEITMEMSSPMLGSQKIQIIYAVKGDKVLQTADDPKVGKMTVYSDLQTGTQIIVQEAQKQGMEIDQSMIEGVMKRMKMQTLVPKPTGKKEKIGGYNSELYTIMIDSTQEMDLWLTKDVPKDVAQGIRNCTDVGMRSTGIKSDALMNLLRTGYAQVRLEVKQDGVTQITNNFIKAEPKKLSDAMFIVPSDIKVTKFDPNNPPGRGAGGQ